MTERWGLYWRWTLLVAMVVLFAARYATSRCWVNRVVVVGGGGPPTVVVALSARHRTLERWDWNANRMEPITTLDRSIFSGMLCTGDGKFVWLVKGILHTVDLESPYEHREWKTSLPNDDKTHAWDLLGTSANSRFVAVQCRPYPNGSAAYTWETDLLVIDLHTGEEVLKKRWGNQTEPSPILGEFKSRAWRPVSGQNNGADWRLTDHGTMEMLPPDPTRYTFVEVARDAAGNSRGLAIGEALAPGEVRENTEAKAISPSKEHILLRRQDRNGRLLLAHAGRRDVQMLQNTVYYFMTSCFTANGKHVFVGDIYGDVQVFEAETGRIVARTRSALVWHCAVVGLAAAFLLVGLGWLILSLRQRAPLWTIVDLHVAAMAGQMGVFSLVGMETPIATISEWLMPLIVGVLPAATAAFGMAVGWYWVYGRAKFGVKFKWGVVSILAIGVAPTLTFVGLEYDEYWLIRLALPCFAGLFAASVTAFLLSPIGMLGWRASDEPIAIQARRFGLASMMLLIAGASVALGFLKLIFGSINGPEVLDVAMAFVPTGVVGLLFPAIVMMNIRRRWRIALGIGVAALVVAGMAARSYQRPLFTSPPVDFALYGFPATTALIVVGMATLARRFGWRWRKAQATAGEVPSLEAAS